jgi:exodeoxyribonuclease V alpha subunit
MSSWYEAWADRYAEWSAGVTADVPFYVALALEADGLLVELPEDEAPRLQLAYACSIHKGQGIELPVAIVIAHAAAGPRFLRREMLYTAMTRARTATLIVGQRAVVARAAATPDTSRRHSRLADRLA